MLVVRTPLVGIRWLSASFSLDIDREGRHPLRSRSIYAHGRLEALVSRPWRCTIPYFRKRFPGVGLIVALSVLLVPLLSGLMSATAASPTEYGLIVRVIGPDANGNMVPLTNAVVRISGGSSTLSHVNANGEAALTTTVPAGEFFMMGDNRDQSYDSRFWGFVKRDEVEGRAMFIYWSWGADSQSFLGIRWSRFGMAIR